MLAVRRFQVMALLQAARAHVLGLPLESAYSWGLNRAIFIAAAKRGFKGGGGGAGEKKGTGADRGAGTYQLGDDMAYKQEKNGVMLFTIGGDVQTKEAFERQIKARFGKTFASAWKESLTYVKTFDKDTLLTTSDFFNKVYKPRRDELAEKWTKVRNDAMDETK